MLSTLRIEFGLGIVGGPPSLLVARPSLAWIVMWMLPPGLRPDPRGWLARVSPKHLASGQAQDLQVSPRSFGLKIFLELHEASGRDILPKNCEVGLPACHRAALSYEGGRLDVGHMAMRTPASAQSNSSVSRFARRRCVRHLPEAQPSRNFAFP